VVFEYINVRIYSHFEVSSARYTRGCHRFMVEVDRATEDINIYIKRNSNA